MAGHSHWAGIKRKKEANDKKRGKIFSKLLKAITIAAKNEANPQFNPRLRSAVDAAIENQVPKDNIERAIKKAAEGGENLEELLMEAYGPEGVAILITAITDNRNRTVAEIKKILKDHNAKWADPGSVLWAFDPPAGGEGEWQPKFPQAISKDAMEKLTALAEELDDHDDVEDIITNNE